MVDYLFGPDETRRIKNRDQNNDDPDIFVVVGSEVTGAT